MSNVSPEIFKAYDIRGINGRDLDADGAHEIDLLAGGKARRRAPARAGSRHAPDRS
jgi:hypothetical protein